MNYVLCFMVGYCVVGPLVFPFMARWFERRKS